MFDWVRACGIGAGWSGFGAWSNQTRRLAWVHSMCKMHLGALYHNAIYVCVYIYYIIYSVYLLSI